MQELFSQCILKRIQNVQCLVTLQWTNQLLLFYLDNNYLYFFIEYKTNKN